MRAQLFLGIGAQKAGTTWLAEYLAGHPQVGFSPYKELHYFNSVYLPELCPGRHAWYIDALSRACHSLSERPSAHELATIRCLTLRVEAIDDPRRYLEYFDLLAEPQHRVVGEITPWYSLLDEDGFAGIRSLAPGAKFVFILRDPVERYWSNLRFLERVLGDTGFTARGNLRSGLSEPIYVLASDYARTLRAMTAAGVPESDLCVLFYEHLVNPDTHASELRRLTDFLGIDYVPGDITRRVNGTGPMPIAVEELREIACRFRHVLEYVIDRYDRVPAAWRDRLASLDTVGATVPVGASVA